VKVESGKLKVESRKWKVKFEEYENTEIWRYHCLAKSKVFGGQYLYWIFCK